jgi:hypothetical protein
MRKQKTPPRGEEQFKEEEEEAPLLALRLDGEDS